MSIKRELKRRHIYEQGQQTSCTRTRPSSPSTPSRNWRAWALLALLWAFRHSSCSPGLLVNATHAILSQQTLAPDFQLPTFSANHAANVCRTLLRGKIRCKFDEWWRCSTCMGASIGTRKNTDDFVHGCHVPVTVCALLRGVQRSGKQRMHVRKPLSPPVRT